MFISNLFGVFQDVHAIYRELSNQKEELAHANPAEESVVVRLML